MKARIPSHREFIINFPDSVDQAKANDCLLYTSDAADEL